MADNFLLHSDDRRLYTKPTGDDRPLSVLALTRTDPARHQTWTLRVGLLVPHLAALNIRVETRTIPTGRQAKVEFFRTLGRYDIVWLHRYTTWPWELRRYRRLGQYLVLDIDDPVGYSSSKYANFSLSRWLKFRATAKGCSAVLAASDKLVELAGVYNRRTALVRLCADPTSHSRQTHPRLPGEPLRLMWVGTRSTFKYLEQIKSHLEAIGRLGRAIELVVVGHQQLQLAQLSIVNIPWSRASESEQFARCHIGLVPLASDRWTEAKATLKPLQYLANGMPFVGSPVGVNRRIADEGRNGLLANTPEEWASAIARLEADEALRLQMGKQGIAYIQAHHAPEVLAALVAREFRALTSVAGLPRETLPLAG